MRASTDIWRITAYCRLSRTALLAADTKASGNNLRSRTDRRRAQFPPRLLGAVAREMPNLAHVVAAWPDLPDAIRRAVLALVATAAAPDNT
jgi:hypothetical protein